MYVYLLFVLFYLFAYTIFSKIHYRLVQRFNLHELLTQTKVNTHNISPPKCEQFCFVVGENVVMNVCENINSRCRTFSPYATPSIYDSRLYLLQFYLFSGSSHLIISYISWATLIAGGRDNHRSYTPRRI